MAPIKGISLLPPCLTQKQAIELLTQLNHVHNLIGQLHQGLRHSVVNEALLNLFSLAESVQSTRIEGTQITFHDLFDPEAESKKAAEQREVYNYQATLMQGFSLIKEGLPFSTRLITTLHKTLMQEARGTRAAGGQFRKIQNFIGPDSNIEHAVYIPVGAGDIPLFMENLEYYVNGEPHRSYQEHTPDGYVVDCNADPILKLAVMHAQFESIHPFLDGNGRMGRILIALMAYKFNQINSPCFFVSQQLERERLRYHDLLNGVRGNHPNWMPWLQFFVSCSGAMASELLSKITAAENLAILGLEKCSSELERRVWLHTFKTPRSTASAVAAELGISPTSARKYLRSLADKNMIYAQQPIRRNQQFINYDLLGCLTNAA